MHAVRFGIILALLPVAPALRAAEHSPLLPRPREVRYGTGQLRLRGAGIRFASSPNEDDRYAAGRLQVALQDRAGAAVPLPAKPGHGPAVVLRRTGNGAGLPRPGEQPGPESREAYTIRVTPRGAEISANASAGLYCGVQTMIQLIEGSGPGAAIPAVEIRDWPALAYRGTMVDMSHGPLPTEAEVKRHLDWLSRWKGNQYFFYSEASIEMPGYALLNPKARFSADQVRRIVEYGRQRHVDVVPCVELYGHLHDLLRVERYADLGVLPRGQDLNALDPRVIPLVSAWLDELARLFPSPFIHIGFDEPYELEKSAELTGAPASKLYLDQLTRVVNLAQGHGKRVLFWTDMSNVFQKHPEALAALPSGIIGVPWHDYMAKDYAPWLEPLSARGIPEFASTYIHNCLSIVPNFDYTFTMIDGLLAAGRRYGASGMLVNMWADDGQDLYRMAWPAMAYGAAASWQAAPMARAQFFSGYAGIVYPPAVAADVGPALRELSDAESRLEKIFGEATQATMWEDPFSRDRLNRYRAHQDELHQVRLLAEQAQEHFGHALSLGGDPRTLASLELGARMLDYTGMKLLYAVQIDDFWQKMGTHPDRRQFAFTMREVTGIVHVPVPDLMDGITGLREDYRKAWLDECTTYRMGTSLGKFDREYLYWYEFSRWQEQVRRGFRQGAAVPALESYRPGFTSGP